VAALISEARRQLDELNPDSAGGILVRVLDPSTGANRAERVRALVLLGIAELMMSDPDKARLNFQQALALDPRLRVDSLADLQTFLLTTFDAARLSAARGAEPGPGILEILNAPASAEVIVDGARWEVRRDTVRPGLHRIQVLASGYAPFIDSVMVDSGATVLRQVALRLPVPAAAAEQRPVTPPAGPAAQPQVRPVATAAAHREGSIELSVGAGVFSVDPKLNGYLEVLNIVDPAPGRFMFGGAARVGYNFTQKLGLSLGSGFGVGNGASLLSPFAALTYTPDLNKKMSPFITVGAGLTRISGNGNRVTASGFHLGIGVRSMLGEKLALRVEGRMAYEPWSSPVAAWDGNAAFNITATLGLSYFMGGGPRRASLR
jgi:opacity protein-like surface antigen